MRPSTSMCSSMNQGNLPDGMPARRAENLAAKQHGAAPFLGVAPARLVQPKLVTIPATAAATAATASEITARAAVPARTLFLGAGDVDCQLALAQRCAVHGGNRLLRLF